MPTEVFPLLFQYSFLHPFIIIILFSCSYIILGTLFTLTWVSQKPVFVQAETRMDVGATAQSSYRLQWESQQDMNILGCLNGNRKGFKTCPPTQGCFQFFFLCLELKKNPKPTKENKPHNGLYDGKKRDWWTSFWEAERGCHEHKKCWRAQLSPERKK